MLDKFTKSVQCVARQDVEGVVEARRHYGDSWRAEGGFSAWFNIKRKIDRLVKLMGREPAQIQVDPNTFLTRERFDIFSQISADLATGGETVLDTVRDARRYLLLVEAWLVEQGHDLPLSRDNLAVEKSDRRQADLRDAVVVRLPLTERVVLYPGDNIYFDPDPHAMTDAVAPTIPAPAPRQERAEDMGGAAVMPRGMEVRGYDFEFDRPSLALEAAPAQAEIARDGNAGRPSAF